MLHNVTASSTLLDVMAGVSGEPLNMCLTNNGDRFE